MKFKEQISLLFLFVGIGFVAYEFSPQRNNAQTKINDNDNVPEFKYKVLNVHDGDTIKVRSGNQNLNIRFACIDAPELKQPGGVEAKDYLKSLIQQSKGYVGLNIISKDRYDRTIAEVWVNLPSEDFPNGSPNLVQSLLAATGKVYAYDQYKKDCPNWDGVKDSENYARQNNLGVWGDRSAVKPWDWRRRNKK